MRMLIAGVGNVLRRDDGFGVEVARRLATCWRQDSAALPDGVNPHVIEVGIGGIHLVQELMVGYDALVIVDAVERGSCRSATCAACAADRVLRARNGRLPGRLMLATSATSFLSDAQLTPCWSALPPEAQQLVAQAHALAVSAMVQLPSQANDDVLADVQHFLDNQGRP